ncbi:hypothetical protein C8Q80DRAFT_1103277 [Daedaleopsis nitida]|nr:hypothetical protein C8Q80DRAFT_1103277 [Daedaleopsis nitida]
MFQSIQKVFERNVELIGSDRSAKDKAWSLVTKMVNALTAASEIGGPVAAMYLLKHPDHYTGHKFRACFWRGYALEVMQAWEDSKDISQEGRSTVVVDCEKNNIDGPKRIVALSPVIDYMNRPVELEHLNVYDWIRRYHKRPIPKCHRKTVFLQPDPNDLEREVCVTIEHQPKANTPSYFNFSAKHPQARTHEVCLLDEKESYVPNFIGGAIPRKDARSRE